MRVLVVAASGVLGTQLIPQLRQRGHEVIGTSRSAGKSERLRALGAEPAVLDVLDAGAVRAAVAAARPDAIIYQATALTELNDFKHFDASFAATNRLRTKGTDNVLAAASAAGVQRIIAQSYGQNRYARQGGPVKTEDDPLDPAPPAAARQTFAALAYLDEAVTGAGGIVLRYGNFYGDPGDRWPAILQARRFPVVGNGEGVWSHIHLHDAAAATVLALEHDGPAVYNITDDDPAPIRVWLPELAKIVGARPPQHFPRLAARIFAGEVIVVMSTQARGAANAKARRELGWSLRYPSWRQGFAAAYGPQPVTAGSRLRPSAGRGRGGTGIDLSHVIVIKRNIRYDNIWLPGREISAHSGKRGYSFFPKLGNLMFIYAAEHGWGK